MKEKLLAYYLNDLNRLKDLNMDVLDQWIEEFPYCQNLHFLKAKKYQIDNRLEDLQVFHKASTYSTDRAILYSRLVNSEVERTKYIIEFRKKMLVKKEKQSKAAKATQITITKNGQSEKKSKLSIENLDIEDPFEKEILEEQTKSLKKKNKKKETPKKSATPKQKLKKDKKSSQKKKVNDDAKKELEETQVTKSKKSKKKRKDKKKKDKKNRKDKKGKTDKKDKKVEKDKKGKKTKSRKKPKRDIKPKRKKRTKKSKAQKKNKKNKKVRESYIKNLEPSSEFTQWLMGLQSTTIEDTRKNKGIFQKVAKQEKKRKAKKKKHQAEQSKINKSLVLQEDIISESLAQLLASQGHHEKAIDMYEKLSLVFPQKSSFFAVQIEKLRK